VNAPPVRRWLVEAAERVDSALGALRVRRVVLPPLVDNPGKEGEFCAVQLEDGSAGLAFTLLDGTLSALHALEERSFSHASAMQLVRGYAGGELPARTLGLAAINALTHALYARAGFLPDDSIDSFGSLALAPGDRLGMVGFFTPLVTQARALGIPVTVLELKASLAREEPGLLVTLDPRRLADCNKIVSTSTLLLNDTFEQVSALWRGAQAVALVGPSAGCPPDRLFAQGVSAVGTAWVVDAEALLARLAVGAKWGNASRKVTLVPQRYPGLERLLASLR
jgi:uncharacterized protein (DUF4213/DUF364 family)